ncbi:MAG: PorT family protein [Saprospiraceae bacterium]|nr:PorT family protein [Saprospiraceae bacterium]
MKHLINSCFVILFISFSFLLNAQLGVRAGVNLANLSIDPEDENFSYGTKLGFGVGVFYKLKAGDNLTIQPELNFMQQGAKAEFDFLGETAKSTISFNYLQVPVFFKYGFGDMDATNFFVQAGPYVGMGIGKVVSESCIGGDCEEDEAEYGDGEDGPKNPDYGVQLGAGVNINSNISVDARYILGLANLNAGDEGSIKHTGINVSIGYSF